jgi:hypothetical protein
MVGHEDDAFPREFRTAGDDDPASGPAQGRVGSMSRQQIARRDGRPNRFQCVPKCGLLLYGLLRVAARSCQEPGHAILELVDVDGQNLQRPVPIQLNQLAAVIVVQMAFGLPAPPLPEPRLLPIGG